MKRLKELTALDFTGLDAMIFRSWKRTMMRMKKNALLIIGALIVVNTVVIMVLHTSVIPGVALLMLTMFFVFKRQNELRNRFGIPGKEIRKARRNCWSSCRETGERFWRSSEPGRR